MTTFKSNGYIDFSSSSLWRQALTAGYTDRLRNGYGVRGEVQIVRDAPNSIGLTTTYRLWQVPVGESGIVVQAVFAFDDSDASAQHNIFNVSLHLARIMGYNHYKRYKVVFNADDNGTDELTFTGAAKTVSQISSGTYNAPTFPALDMRHVSVLARIVRESGATSTATIRTKPMFINESAGEAYSVIDQSTGGQPTPTTWTKSYTPVLQFLPDILPIEVTPSVGSEYWSCKGQIRLTFSMLSA